MGTGVSLGLVLVGVDGEQLFIFFAAGRDVGLFVFISSCSVAVSCGNLVVLCCLEHIVYYLFLFNNLFLDFRRSKPFITVLHLWIRL